jgi:N-glycosylase/DNA lyase
MEEVTRLIPGVRVVRQEPLECLISFICSSNNNIGRITLMLDKLRTKYGKQIAEVKHGQEKEVKKELATLKIFSFPTLSELATATEDDLRQMGEVQTLFQ